MFSFCKLHLFLLFEINWNCDITDCYNRRFLRKSCSRIVLEEQDEVGDDAKDQGGDGKLVLGNSIAFVLFAKAHLAVAVSLEKIF